MAPNRSRGVRASNSAQLKAKQHLQSLAFGLVPDERKPRVIEFIKSRGDKKAEAIQDLIDIVRRVENVGERERPETARVSAHTSPVGDGIPAAQGQR